MYALRITDKVIEDDFIGTYRYETVEEAEKAGEELVEKYTEDEVEYKVLYWFREEQNKNHRNRGMETVQEFVQKWRSGASEPTPVS